MQGALGENRAFARSAPNPNGHVRDSHQLRFEALGCCQDQASQRLASIDHRRPPSQAVWGGSGELGSSAMGTVSSRRNASTTTSPSCIRKGSCNLLKAEPLTIRPGQCPAGHRLANREIILSGRRIPEGQRSQSKPSKMAKISKVRNATKCRRKSEIPCSDTESRGYFLMGPVLPRGGYSQSTRSI